MKKDNLVLVRFLYFFGGLYIIAIGKVMLIYAGYGVDPLTVFHLSISYHSPFTMGRVTQIVAAIMLIIGWMLKMKPQIGTFLNMYIFGMFLDSVSNLSLLKEPDSFPMTIVYLILGIILNGAGTGIYINAQLGAGPIDGFMLGLSKATGKPVGFVRTCMEATALLIGWLLGGPVGLGTLCVALFLGPIIQLTLKLTKLPEKSKGDDIKETL
jgi:uncharacterized membrane protein YczE